MTWPVNNKVKANIGLNCHLCAVNSFYTHLVTKNASQLEYCLICNKATNKTQKIRAMFIPVTHKISTILGYLGK